MEQRAIGRKVIRIGPRSNIRISADFDIKAEAIGAIE